MTGKMSVGGVVTAIVKQKNNRRRLNIFLDGEFAFSLEPVVAGWLQIGQVLDEKAVEELKRKDIPESAFEKAMHFMNYRERTSEEIRQKLAGLGFDEQVIESVLTRMETSRLVDDERFARLWIESRNNHRPSGSRLLKMELRRKGIPEPVVNEAIEQAGDEAELALSAVRSHIHRWAELDKKDFRLKVYRFLVSRGFSYDVVQDTVEKLWNEIPHADFVEK